MIRPRKHIEELKPYVPGEQPQQGEWIKLNTNENPYPPSPEVLRRIKNQLEKRVRLYPDPLFKNLRRAAARRWKVSEDDIFVGNGSDEVLRLLFQSYLTPGDSVAALFPTYTLYETLADIFDARMIYYETHRDLRIPSAFFSSMSHRIMCIANPNPPTGTFYEPVLLRRICKVNSKSLILIDEAYVDFAPRNALELIREFDNVVIVRTFSKSPGLAGLRIGFGIAKNTIISTLYKIKDSYNVNFIAQIAATAALDDTQYYRDVIKKIKASRRKLSRQLRNLGFDVPDSAANFVFAQWHENAQWIYEELKRRKILVRYFDHPLLRNGLRISIGKESDNDILISSLKGIIKDGKKTKKRTNR